jgi:hypothetical protein
MQIYENLIQEDNAIYISSSSLTNSPFWAIAFLRTFFQIASDVHFFAAVTFSPNRCVAMTGRIHIDTQTDWIYELRR